MTAVIIAMLPFQNKICLAVYYTVAAVKLGPCKKIHCIIESEDMRIINILTVCCLDHTCCT